MRHKLLMLSLAAIALRVAMPAQTHQPVPAVQAFSKVPISFEENRGQVDSQVRFLAHMQRSAMFFTPAEAVLTLYSENSEKRPIASDIHIRWVGGNANATVSAEEGLPGKVNYLVGKNPANWHTNLATYAKVRYRNIYPGVDAVFYGKQGELEYDLVLTSAANAREVRLAFDGVQQTEVASDGELVLKLKDGEVRQGIPKVYQEIGGKRQMVAAKYVLHNDNTVGFDVQGADPKRQLIIDPTLSYSTYLGSTTNDYVSSVAVDQYGRVYATGWTVSGFPTKNPFQKVQRGQNAFVTKFDATGGGLIYSTYLGGSSYDDAYAIAVDRNGSAYVAGNTGSADFPFTPGSYQSTDTDGDDGFIVKLNPSGSSLAYASRLGGGDSDTIYALALDTQHRVYVAGYTCSTNFPTVNAYQATDTSQNCADGGGSAFVTRLNAAGTALDYSTYLDGTTNSLGFGIAVDSTYHAYVTGETISSNFPITAGAFQTTYHGAGDFGDENGFVTKFSADGKTLVYSTYLGGSVSDVARAIAVDGSGHAYVAGSAGSKDFPTTAGAFQRTLRGSGDAFVTKFKVDGSGLVYSTFLGGTGSDGASSIAVDSQGQAHVAGATSSSNFPLLNPIQKTYGGAGDAFVTKLSSTGAKLIYSTYLGGKASDSASCVRLDSADAAYVGGGTASTNFPTTSGAYSRSYKGGGNDGWVAKIKP
jgi:hypothetical protein